MKSFGKKNLLHETHEPVRKVKQRIKGAAKEVTQPHLIGLCNKGMGRVDLMDCLLESYCPTICGKKWYWILFINFLNVTVVAAWRIYCQIGQQKVSHLEFWRQVTLCLLKADENLEIDQTVNLNFTECEI